MRSRPSRRPPPRPRRFRFSNGLTVLFLQTENDPVSAAHLFLPRGSGHEADALAGVTTLHWSLLTKGTRRRSARGFAEEVEGIGASIGAGGAHDYSEVSRHALSDYFDRAFDLFSESLFEPAFEAGEIEKERKALLAAIRAKRESLFTVASERLYPALFSTHPYSRPATGWEKTVKKIRRKDLLAWHERVVSPSGAVLAVASPQPWPRLRAAIDRLFGPARWPRRRGLPSRLGATPRRPVEFDICAHEHFEQAYLLYGYPAPPISSPDYLPLKLLNAHLGGGMSARLFQELREKNGLAYDVGSFYASKQAGSMMAIYLGLQASRIPDAEAGIKRVLHEVMSHPLRARDLQETKNYVNGTFVLDHQTNSQRAHYLGWWEILGRDAAFDRAYPAAIQNVSAADVQRVARRILRQKPVRVRVLPGKKTDGKK